MKLILIFIAISSQLAENAVIHPKCGTEKMDEHIKSTCTFSKFTQEDKLVCKTPIYVDDIILENGNLFEFDENALVGCGKYHSYLKIKNCSLQVMYPSALKSANLRQFHVPSNFLFTMPRDLFEYPKNIIVLNFTANFIRNLDKEFRSLINLLYLDLSHNTLEEIKGSNFETLRNLKSLNLSFNKISLITTDAFDGLKSLKVLDLSFNRLESTYNIFRKLNNLEELHLHGNPFKTLDKDFFKGLTNLRSFEIRNLDFFLEIREGAFTGLSKVSKINISEKYLKTIPLLLFAGLGNLKMINISHNRLSVIPNVDGITEIDVSYNEITTFFINYGKLINACNNKIKTLIFQDSLMAEKLYFCHNELSEIKENVFKNEKNLILLDLSFNKISIIHDNSFAGLISLQILNLKGNKLVHIPDEIFTCTPNLFKVNLSNNLIRVFNVKEFKRNTKLKEIDLEGNMRECGQLFMLINKLEELNILIENV